MKFFNLPFKIPDFLKSKTVLILMAGLLILFLLTPLSVMQINRKVSGIINEKAAQSLRQLERETGLKIRWERLNFNLLMFRVELKEVVISNSFNLASKKNLLFDFLNGPQFLAEVSLRPRVFYSFFKRAVHLSSVQMRGGEFHLKTAAFIQKKLQKRKELNLPVQRIFIKNTHIQVRHGENELNFTGALADIRKTGFGNYKFQSAIKAVRINHAEAFEFRARGRTSGRRIFMKHISFKNKSTDAQISLLQMSFDHRGIHRMETKSSGIISSSLIEQSVRLFHQQSPMIKGIFNYSFHLTFQRRKGFQGEISVHSDSPVVQNVPLKTLSVRGILKKDSFSAHSGFIETKNSAKIKIKEIKFFPQTETAVPAFTLSIDTQRLSLDFIVKNVLKADSFSLVQTVFSGPLDCAGVVDFSHINCKGLLQSPKTVIQIKQKPVVSFYNMRINWDGVWKDSALNFNFLAEKDDTTRLIGSGRYSHPANEISLKLKGFSLLKEDTKFAVPFELKGAVQIADGVFKVAKNNFTVEGLISSEEILLNQYNINNITSFVQMKNKILFFRNIRGRTGKSVYEGNVVVDFTEEKAEMKISSSFFDIQDLKTVLGAGAAGGLKIKGTGEGIFETALPFSKKQTRDFRLAGHLFNAQIDKEFFPGIDFDISFQKGVGNVRSLVFRKGKGSLSGAGRFDRDFNLDVNLKGAGIPLERIEFLNSLLPFSQSGLVNFSGKLKGAVSNPEFQGGGEITNAVFYTYPADNSRLNIVLKDKKLFLSGNLMNELLLEELSYDFQKKKSLYIRTKLHKWDFINLFLARMKKENLREFFSELTGKMELNIQDKAVSGLIEIDKLLISQGNKWMKNERPFSLHITPSSRIVSPVQLTHYDDKVLKVENNAEGAQAVSGHTHLGLWSLWFPFFRRMEGEAGIDFIMDKNLKSFRPEGQITIKNGFLSLPPLSGFTDINARVSLQDDKITLTQFDSLYGDGVVRGGGVISYGYGKKPPTVSCLLNFADSQINIPKGFFTRGSGFLKIVGTRPPYTIKGDYTIDSGNILKDWSGTKGNEFINSNLFASKKSKLDDSLFHLDLKIHATRPLLIKNSIIRAPARGTLRVHGPLKNLLLSGLITLAEESKTEKSGIITFRDREFEINTASVAFDNSPPGNPVLNVTAHTALKAKVTDEFLSDSRETTKDYRVFLTAKGPSRNLKITLSAIPFLSEKEIISLLAFGMTTQRFDENIKENITQYSYQFLGSYLLQRPLGKELRDTLNLDLDIAPYLNTKSSEPATKVTLKKNWLKNLQTSISRTIEEKPVSDARLKYHLKKNISLTAFWEDTEKNLEDGTEKDTLGLDLEFNFEF